ncbi:MAG: HAMP domain-containing histidine kinase [Paraglaciecola sp.]|nr:HAMP domain-containing histidine kinase [Paraglaciecola sp.]
MLKVKGAASLVNLPPPESEQSAALEIACLRAELSQAKKDLNEFIYLASHDLKAPLNAIDNLANWLVEDIGSEIGEESLHLLSMIKSRAERAKLLVSDLLLYSRIGNEAEEYEFINFHQTVMLCAAQADVSQFELVIDGCDPTLPKLSFISVLMQLISNAVKHHGTDSGKISITCKQLTHAYHIEVSDDGPGIHQDDQEKVFNKFQTLKSRDEVEGSGMGLALVVKTLSLYAAKITLVSDGKSGSMFVIEWPFEPIQRKTV